MEQASVKNYSSTTAAVKMPHVQSKISAMLDGNWNSGVERLTRYAGAEGEGYRQRLCGPGTTGAIVSKNRRRVGRRRSRMTE